LAFLFGELEDLMISVIRILSLMICLLFVVKGNGLCATDVGGIINEDTVWDLNGSPYNLTETVWIIEDVTLTVNPGVVIRCNSLGYPIYVYGELKAIGMKEKKITFEYIIIFPADDSATEKTPKIFIQFANFDEFVKSHFYKQLK
jgi:hypothetical protein